MSVTPKKKKKILLPGGASGDATRQVGSSVERLFFCELQGATTALPPPHTHPPNAESRERLETQLNEPWLDFLFFFFKEICRGQLEDLLKDAHTHTKSDFLIVRGFCV